MVAEVQGRGGVGVANELQVLVHLRNLLLHRLQSALLSNEALLGFAADHFHAARHIAFFNLLPCREGLGRAVQVAINGAAAEAIDDADGAVRLQSRGERIDLLMRSNTEGHVPVVLAVELGDGLLRVGIAGLRRPAT